MSDYTKTTNFAAKDALPSGNVNKTVRGAEFDTEFDNIATAIATKANSASPTLTGTTSAEAVTATTVTATGVVAGSRLKESDPSAVLARASANQTSGAVGAKITFDTETFDLSGDFASSVFTAEHDGIYVFTANVYYYNTSGSAQDTFAYLYHSTAGQIGSGTRFSLANGLAAYSNIAVVCRLLAGETVEIRNGGTALGANYYVTGSGFNTYFSAKLLTRI